MNITLLLCRVEPTLIILGELKDWKSEGIRVLSYGATTKAKNGYIFIAWDKPMPEWFHQKLIKDPDILDYFTFSNEISAQLSQAE